MTRAPLRVPEPDRCGRSVGANRDASANNLPAVSLAETEWPCADTGDQSPPQGTKSYPSSIAKAIIAIKRGAGAIEKNAKHERGYMYQAWDDILNAVSPLITDHGLIIIQSETGRSVPGGDLVMINYEFTITHESGEVWPDRPTRSSLSMLRPGADLSMTRRSCGATPMRKRHFTSSF